MEFRGGNWGLRTEGGGGPAGLSVGDPQVQRLKWKASQHIWGTGGRPCG